MRNRRGRRQRQAASGRPGGQRRPREGGPSKLQTGPGRPVRPRPPEPGDIPVTQETGRFARVARRLLTSAVAVHDADACEHAVFLPAQPARHSRAALSPAAGASLGTRLPGRPRPPDPPALAPTLPPRPPGAPPRPLRAPTWPACRRHPARPWASPGSAPRSPAERAGLRVPPIHSCHPTTFLCPGGAAQGDQGLHPVPEHSRPPEWTPGPMAVTPFPSMHPRLLRSAPLL